MFVKQIFRVGAMGIRFVLSRFVPAVFTDSQNINLPEYSLGKRAWQQHIVGMPILSQLHLTCRLLHLRQPVRVFGLCARWRTIGAVMVRGLPRDPSFDA